MNKFSLTMSGLIAIAVIFFGINMIQKVNYVAATGDTVQIAYNVKHGEDTFTDQTATVTIGSNTDKMFTDKRVTGLKINQSAEFEDTLKEANAFGGETEIKKGEKVTVDAKVSNIIPASTTADNSETTSEK